MMIRSYTELMQIETFEDRFEYLKIRARVGEETFGLERYLNQRFYTSSEWRSVRDFVTARDLGQDLAVVGRPIQDRLIIHHMNPMTPDDITGGNADILNPEYLIATGHNTHNAIHYGSEAPKLYGFAPRTQGDTKLW